MWIIVSVVITIILAVIIIILLMPKKAKYRQLSKKDTHSRKYKALVLVKVSNPTQAQIKRYFKWKKAMSSDYRFEILSDRYLTIPHMKVNVIYPTELIKKWPKLLKMGGNCYNRSLSYIMWVSIIEHYILCVKRSKITFKYLWMIEQDLGYSGNLYEFMKQYENKDVDIVTREWIKQTTDWWSECYTPEYYNWRIKYHYNYKYQSYNWLSRINHKVIDILYNEFELGRHAQNEEALSEKIDPFKLTYIFFNRSYHGYKYNWNSHIYAEEWKQILSDEKHKNKLFHALKF